MVNPEPNAGRFITRWPPAHLELSALKATTVGLKAKMIFSLTAVSSCNFLLH